MAEWEARLWNPESDSWEDQPLVQWAKEAADTKELLARVWKETGVRVARRSVSAAMTRKRKAGMELPNFRVLYGTAKITEETSTTGPERKLEKKLATAKGSLEQERRRTRALQKELYKAQEVLDFRQQAEGFDEEIKIRSPRNLPKSRRAGTPIIMASDWHVDEVVNALKVNHVNEYSPDIAKERAGKFFRGVVWKMRQAAYEYDCSEAILWAGGDFITGFIHETYKESNSMSPVEGVRYWKSLFRAGIEMMLEELPDLQVLHVVCNYGNHGRTTLKPIDGAIGARNSYEHGAYLDLQEYFAARGEGRVDFRISEGTLEYVQVYEWMIRFTHGDKGVKFRDAIGGISTAARKAVMGWDTSRPADYTVMGHWHSWQTPFQDIVVNGSLIGYNAFAQDIKARWEPPQQGFWVLDEERGRRHTESIWVSSYGARRPLQ